MNLKRCFASREHVKNVYASVLCRVLVKPTREMQGKKPTHFEDGEMKTQKVPDTVILGQRWDLNLEFLLLRI